MARGDGRVEGAAWRALRARCRLEHDLITNRAPILDAFAFYRESPDEVRRAMAAAAQHAVLSPGTFFYREGEFCPHFALVVSGDIRVYKTTGSGREITLYHVLDGEPCLVNLLCVTLGRPAMAHAHVDAETAAVVFPATLLPQWLAASPPLQRYVFETIATRVVDVMTLVQEVAFERMDSRLAALLLQRLAAGGTLAATHEEIASELGTAREVVSRLLREFARRGAIRVGRGHIELKDADVLRHLM